MKSNRYPLHREVCGLSVGRVGRPKRYDKTYDYRRVPDNYRIPQAFIAWVSPRKP